MPAILAREDYVKWLAEMPGSPDELRALLKPCAASMEAAPVSTTVDIPRTSGRNSSSRRRAWRTSRAFIHALPPYFTTRSTEER
jgi:putative SOS response-associated peptidase YedK